MCYITIYQFNYYVNHNIEFLFVSTCKYLGVVIIIKRFEENIGCLTYALLSLLRQRS